MEDLLLIDYIKLPLSKRKKHIDLKSSCIPGGDSELGQLRIELAKMLGIYVPCSHVHCNHACLNKHFCVNLLHCYFGTPKENYELRNQENYNPPKKGR